MAKDILETGFLKHRFKQTLTSHKEVIEKYKLGFEDAKNLKGNSPIFLDANVLLRIYSISFKAREKMRKFLDNHLDRIIITGQVQWEYVKNRESVINRFFKDVTSKIPEAFSSEVNNHIDKFIDNHKTVLADYSSIESKLKKLRKTTDDILAEIEKEVKIKKELKNKTIFDDDFLLLLNNAQLLERLPDDTISKLKLEYDDCMLSIDKNEADRDSFKSFPGCGERKEKGDDPYGDFIIYHELMYYSKKNNLDAIFLTHDTTKGDWIKKDGSAHLHYVENYYLNTGQLIYILDAERLFENLFNTSFESLIRPQHDHANLITEQALSSFLESIASFDIFKNNTIEPHYLQELGINNLNSLTTITSALENSRYDLANFLDFLIKERPKCRKFSALRACMLLINSKYKMINSNLTIMQNTVLRSVVEEWKFFFI